MKIKEKYNEENDALSLTGIDKKESFDTKMIRSLMKHEQISNIERQWRR